ncbi:replication protein RepB [Nocardia farcinica]|uniref:replication protein RepB n=1 Tax=Nocardia farcinica TaxID=37329 RepID=UPI0024569612|nr:replication protein RepB [Nocardia farcinica]
MAAKHPVRRNKTAREIAEKYGASPRTIRRLVAEPRAEFEARAAEKRRRAQQLRAEGATYRQIAEDLGVGIGSVSSLLRVPVSSS